MPDLSTSLELCSLCPKLCSHVCPVYRASAKETLSPQAKMSSLCGCGSRGCGAACRRLAAVRLHRVWGVRDGVSAQDRTCAAPRAGRALVERRELGHPALSDLPERVFHRAQETSRALLWSLTCCRGWPGPGRLGFAVVSAAASCRWGPVSEAKQLFVCARCAAVAPGGLSAVRSFDGGQRWLSVVCGGAR